MKALLVLAAALLLAQPLFAAEAAKIEIKAEDTPATLLFRLVGQKVEIHLKNGEKLSGKLESATGGGVHLSNLIGQEFFDAVISATDITAVVVRTH